MQRVMELTQQEQPLSTLARSSDSRLQRGSIRPQKAKIEKIKISGLF
jgi:hypothetical protein